MIDAATPYRRTIAVEDLLYTGSATWCRLDPDGIVFHNGQPEMVHHICPLDGKWKEETARLCADCETEFGPIIDRPKVAS